MPKYMNANLSFKNSQIEGLKNLWIHENVPQDSYSTKAHRPPLQYKRETPVLQFWISSF